jgi:hypothetical protein
MSMDTLEWENENISDRSRAISLAMVLPLGVFGAHRFYAGKVGTGILQLCTFGGLGMWWLYDVIMVASGSFRDKEGKRIIRWQEEGFGLSGTTAEHRAIPSEVLDELYALREEMADLTERVDFTERLLTKGQNQDLD